MRGDAPTILAVENGRLERLFLELPYLLHRRDANWVAPLRHEERHRWDSARNPSLRARWTQRFIAMAGSEPVGRIAAIDDAGFADRWEPDAGLFGFFDARDDPAVSSALLAAAADALRTRGRRRMIGPVNLTFHDETGVLVQGFESPPMLLSPYNPAHYARLLEAADCRPLREYHSYVWTPGRPRAPAVERLLAAAQAGVGLARGVRIRPLDRRRWDSDVRAAWQLYSLTFADVWGNTAMSWSEFAERAARFRSFVVPDLVLFAERDGEPVGLALTLPDVNRALAAAQGRLLPLGWLRIARAMARVRTARFAILGVKRDSTGRGIAALLAHETGRALERLGYERVELSLVLDDNARVQHVIQAFGGTPLKRYRLYERAIRAAPTHALESVA